MLTCGYRAYLAAMSTPFDPLAALADEAPIGPHETRVRLLESARRQLVPIRRSFVELPATAGRPSTLAVLVKGRKARALDAELLLLGLEPILDKTPLHSSVWGRGLSPESGPLVSGQSMSKTWAELAEYKLINRDGRIKRLANVLPLREDGSGVAYTRPGKTAKGTTGYFALPTTYWTEGWDQKLTLPAKAMLLVLLSSTTKRPTLNADYPEIARRFGISERTAGRGAAELKEHQLMGVHGQLVAAPRSPNGITTRHHRFATGPFAPERIAEARRADVTAARAKVASTDPPDPSTVADLFASFFANVTATPKGNQP